MGIGEVKSDDPSSPETVRSGAFLPHFPFAIRHWIAVLALLLAAPLARAQAPPHIEKVRIGLPGGPDSGRSRSGAWAPVYVVLKAGAQGNDPKAFRLAVETTDSDAAAYRYTTPVPALTANEERTVLTYVRPGTDGSPFSLKLETSDGKGVQTLTQPPRDPSQGEIVGPDKVFYLALGDRLPGLTRLGLPADGDEAQAQAPEEMEGNSLRAFAHADVVSLMPDRWFGYGAVDVVLLTTGKTAFVRGLAEDAAASRREALLEWVRRGGRLVVSVGRNHELVARLLRDRMPLIDCEIKKGGTPASLPAVRDWAGREVRQSLQGAETARLVPGANAGVLLRERSGAAGAAEEPLLVEGSCGLGRVILVAFDLDRPPFSTWEGQPAFWNRLFEEIGPVPPAKKEAADVEQRRELETELKRSLETFADVPVISFGWVAFFILLYISVIGPLDYFILKRVFKRLELTWVTFPTVVLLVSVAAYFTAHHFKGEDLRVNKVDIVDIDLHGPQPAVHGRAWFTLFSPRIENYTVGLEPSFPGWVPPPAGSPVRGTVVAAMDTPDRSGNRSSHSLFRRPYSYAADAAGLEGVPIPIWATRSFAAAWRRPIDPARPPVEVVIRRTRDRAALVGRIVNHLPVELQDVTLFYRGKWYNVGGLVSEGSFQVSPLFEAHVRARDVPQWFQEWSPPGPGTGPLERQTDALVKPLLFHAASEGQAGSNAGLRFLDQSWRLRPQGRTYREEVILVARVAPRAGRAEEVTAGAAVPSRLWLGQLPDGRTQRPPVPGFLDQVTYVRVFIPVMEP